MMNLNVSCLVLMMRIRIVFTNRRAKLTIHVPKDSNMYLTDNVAESEVILNRDSKFKIYGAKLEGDTFNIFMELIK